MNIKEDKLKAFLADSGLVKEEDFDKAKKEADSRGQKVEDVLVSSGYISENDLSRSRAYILGFPFVDLKDETIDFSILSVIPEPIARNHNIVPFRKSDSALEVAMIDTEDLAAIDFIKKKTGLKILPRLTDKESITHVLQQYQKSLQAEFGDIIQKEVGSIETVVDTDQSGDISEEELKRSAEDLPVVRVVETLLKHAIIQNASDIHIEPLEEKLLVRYRIDGVLHDAMNLPKGAAASILARIKVLSSLKLDEKRLPQDGRFKIMLNNEKVSFRVSTLPTYYGEKAVLRLLRETVSGLDLEKLGFHNEGLDRIHEAIRSTTGMILTTGPTGSGKTTTLYTVLDMLNTPEVNISTVEDPIEYQMKRINQTQVRPEIGFSFANGLRTLLRQDPDVIMVGEIRDGETASLAVNAALTGHLVLSTLHTNSAAGAIPRMVDMKIEPFLLVSTVNVVIAQRLVRKLDGSKKKHFLDREEIDRLGQSIDLNRMLTYLKEKNVIKEDAEWESVPFYRPKEGKGDDDGYKGRVGLYEVLKVSEAIKDLIVKEASDEKIEEQARKEGMLTMMEDGIYKAAKGETSLEEVLRVTYE